MKTFLRWFAIATGLVAALSAFSSSALASPAVEGISIQFTSLEGGKAAGSAVSVFIQNPTGAVVAGSYDFAKGALPGKAVSPDFMIPITHGPLTMDSLSAFKVTVQMQAPPGKTDTWHFTYAIKVRVAGGNVLTRQAAPCVLKSSSGGSSSVPRDFHL